jgi:hypothetical protein
MSIVNLEQQRKRAKDLLRAQARISGIRTEMDKPVCTPRRWLAIWKL